MNARDHQLYMRRCLDLAAGGLGSVAPNPMVGCVVVHRGRIIGEGAHQVYGGPHAEVNAIASVRNPRLLSESSLYVNLEPCSHHGKTPPCTDLILQHRIQKVYIGTRDPNPLVAGKGMEALRAAGCSIEAGLLEKECKNLNKRFFTFYEKRRPYVILKWAQTSDGFIDVVRKAGQEARPTWITSERLRMLVHKWRSEEPAIMVGTHTALLDNPRLNVRNWQGKQPMRVVIDRQLRLPQSLHLFDGSQPTIVFNENKSEEMGLTAFVRTDFGHTSLQGMMDHLHGLGVQSVFVEGGRLLIQSLIDEGLWDEARVFCGPQFFGEGVPSPAIGPGKPARIPIGRELFFLFNNPIKPESL